MFRTLFALLVLTAGALAQAPGIAVKTDANGALILPAATTFRAANSLQTYGANLEALRLNTTGTLTLGNVTVNLAGVGTTPLPWANVTGRPTTLSGYGITDAQPLDSDLTSIAALTTTTFGRSLLTQADAPTARSTLGLGTAATMASTAFQPTITANGILVGNGSGTITAATTTGTGNLVLATSPTLTTPTIASLTIPYASANDVVITRGSSVSPELVISSNNADNTVVLQNKGNTGYAAWAVADLNGKQFFAGGYGNPGSIVPFRGISYLETSDANNAFSGVAPPIYIYQTTKYSDFGRNYYFYLRQSFDPDGTITFHRRDSAPDLGLDCPIVTIAKDAPILTLGSGGIDGASAYGEVRGSDSAHYLALRDPGRGSIASATIGVYGGTLASDAGFAVKTGGARGAQTTRLQVADDGSKFSGPLMLTPSAQPAFTVEGWLYPDSTSHRLTFRNNTGWTSLANLGDIPAAISPANPSVSAGLSAVNGSATTYMRSDAAPAISQSISPTWSGTHTFSGSTIFNGGLVTTTIAVNGQPVPTVLSSTSVNAKTTGNTSLYTVPGGKTCVVTGIVVKVSAASAITSGPTAGVGNVSGTSNIVAGQNMSGLTSTSALFDWPVVGASVTATSAVFLNLTNAATGTSETIVVDVIGYNY